MVSSEVAGPVEEVEPGDRLTIDRVHFEVTAAEHSGKREPLGPVGPAIGCVIRGSRHIYFPGDTDLFPGLEPLRPPRSCARASLSPSTGAPSTPRACGG